jgi:hypothetical protein
MVIKLEANSTWTMTRISADVDCDNWWIAFKPADSVVTEDLLFGKKKLISSNLNFDLK